MFDKARATPWSSRSSRRGDGVVALGTGFVYSAPVNALKGLPSDICDELEILVIVQDDELGQLSGGGNEQVWERCRPVLAPFCERDLDFHGTVFDRWG